MSQLRWALIGLGALFLVALALWEWRRSRRQVPRAPRAEPTAPDVTLINERPRRMEPDLGEMPGAKMPVPTSQQPRRHLRWCRHLNLHLNPSSSRHPGTTPLPSWSRTPRLLPLPRRHRRCLRMRPRSSGHRPTVNAS